MNENNSINILYNFKDELNRMELFGGRSGLIKDIIKKIRWLKNHSKNNDVGMLFVKDIEKKMVKIKEKAATEE